MTVIGMKCHEDRISWPFFLVSSSYILCILPLPWNFMRFVIYVLGMTTQRSLILSILSSQSKLYPQSFQAWEVRVVFGRNGMPPIEWAPFVTIELIFPHNCHTTTVSVGRYCFVGWNVLCRNHNCVTLLLLFLTLYPE